MKYKDYYEILGVSKTATDAEIKSAYRKMAVKYHPDRQQDKSEAEKNVSGRRGSVRHHEGHRPRLPEDAQEIHQGRLPGSGGETHRQVRVLPLITNILRFHTQFVKNILRFHQNGLFLHLNSN